MQNTFTIVFIHKALALWGGIERIWIDKMNYLADQCGYDVHVITYDQGAHAIPYAMSSRIHHVDLGIRFHTVYSKPVPLRFIEVRKKNNKFRRELRRILNEIHPDIITSTTSARIDLIQDVRGKIPYIIESHSGLNDIISNGNKRFARIRKLFSHNILHDISKADVLVCLTEGDKRDWQAVKPAVIIPNIVHLNTSGKYSTCTAKRVIYAGRFSQQKGINHLVNIWKKVHALHPDWQLDMYGEGEDKAHWTSVISAFPDHLGINICEPTPHIFERFQESSIFVLTSVYEPFGLVIPEAMSCGLPVVSFKSPYGPECIIDANSGILVDCYDTEAFARQLCYLIENEGIRKEMGTQAIQRSQRFSAQNIMSQWTELYERIGAKS